jgi:GDP-4-dehydro-6-deoxy-D-mannose reductase
MTSRSAQSALVTGAAGFVGRRLCAHLSSRGWEVVGADVPGTTPAPACVRWASCDITDASALEAAFDQTPPIAHVFHLAAVTFVPDAQRDKLKTIQVNVDGARHVAEAVLHRAPAARLVLVSSADIYGPPRFLPIDEGHPVQPQNVYARSKEQAETWCRAFCAEKHLDLIVMRPFNHTGPGQSDKFVLPSFARQVARIEAGAQPPVMQVGNLEAARDFSHVDDVLRAYELAALEGQSGETYNICSGASVRIADALNRLLAMSKTEIRIETDPARVRPPESAEVRGSHRKLTDATGWQPQISFDRLLHDLLEYWRKQVSLS